MKALILAAGLGTRLGPLTASRPKALVPVQGKPMVLHLLERLSGQGVDSFVINLHHQAAILQEYLESIELPGISIEFSVERDELLDTGGALKKARHHFEQESCFLIHNVDVWTDLDTGPMVSKHASSGAMATLAVRIRPSSRHLLFDENLRLCGWENTGTGDRIVKVKSKDPLIPLAFSGVQVVSPGIFSFFPGMDRFSLVDLYLAALPGGRIDGYLHDEDIWLDLGTPGAIAIMQ